MQGNFNVMILNVRGLRNPVKSRSIFYFLKDQNCEAYFVKLIFSKKPTQSSAMKLFGYVNGEVSFSFRIVKVSAF